MRYKLTFAVGFAAGYMLGAKAGRERYEQINQALRGLSENPAVQSAAGVLQVQASHLVDTAKHAVTDRLPMGGPPAGTSGGAAGRTTTFADPGPGPVPASPGNGAGPR